MKANSDQHLQGDIRVLVVGGNPIARAGLRSSLNASGITVAGESSGGAEAIACAIQTRPDVVLTYASLPDMSGMEATAHVKQAVPTARVIVLSDDAHPTWLRAAIEAGAAGSLAMGQPVADAIRLVSEGGSLVDTEELTQMARNGGPESRVGTEGRMALSELSPRELEVLGHIAEGATNRQIAEQMHYSIGTIRNVVHRLAQKLQVSDRTQAAILAIRAGLSTRSQQTP